MVASVAKTPTYAERAKKAQSIKAPTSIRPSSSVSSPIQPTTPQVSTTPKSHSKSSGVDAPVTAGPSSSLTSQDTGVANANTVNGHVSTTASSTSASSPNMGAQTPLNDLASTTPATTKVPVDNVWNRRKEQMVSRTTATSISSSSTQQVAAIPSSSEVVVEDPFVVQIPPRPGPPLVHDSESWPEVGKSTFPADSKEGSTIWKEQEPTLRKGEKQKWVPIPAAELQAAADAQNQNHKSSSSKQHSRAHSRAQSQKGTNPTRSNNPNTSTAQPGSQNASRAASQAHSRIQSTTHSRIASRSTSAQSSPRLSRGGRKLEDDSSSLITNNVDINVSNLNGSPYAPPRNINPPTQLPTQPVTYVDTTSSDPPVSYSVPLYGPVPISGSPYYALPQQSHDHGSIPPLPIQQTSSQQGSTQGSYSASPLSAPYVLPPGGPNGYPPSNVVSTHGHSPISIPPSQPLSAYPPGPTGYLHVYPPHMYGGMPEYAHGQAASYSHWNGNSHGFPSHPSAAQSPYPPNAHLLAYPQPLSHQPSIGAPSHQRKSVSPSEDQQQQLQLPPPTMIDHPPPPEESKPVAGYREIGSFNSSPHLNGTANGNGSSIKPGSVVFGSIGVEVTSSPPDLDGLINREIAGQQADIESLPKAFTAFSIGVTPDEPKPPRIRSRTSSAKPLAKTDSTNGDLKDIPTVVADSASPNRAGNQEVNDGQNRTRPVDLSGAEKKWQFGSTDVNATLERPEIITSNLDGTQFVHPSSATAEVGEPLGVMDIGDSEQLPPLPLDLQPTPHMVGNERPVQALAPQSLGDEFAIRDFRYGSGLESGPGYGMGVLQGEQLPQDGRREPDMMRDQEIREDGRRWRDEFDYDRGGRGGPGRDRDRDGDAGGMMGRPRRGPYGGYGYERGGYGGRRGRAGGPGGYGRSMHRPRASFHAPPQPRQPPFTVTPPQQQFRPLMQYNDPNITNGYYLPAQSPTSHHQGMATYLPIHTHAQVGYEAYAPIPQHLPAASGQITGPPVPVPLYVNYHLDSTRYLLLSQLEYYLSPQNMAQDLYLRQNMDSKGWISIHLIASFKRVTALTHEFQLVKEVLSLSSVVQVNNDWVRMDGWERFVLPDAKPSVVEAETAELPSLQPNELDHQEDDEDEDEEDVVFVLDDETQRWSPDRKRA
ncbi:hypothetical protein PLEOSDRAFT_1109363 [Pleurotus ostreatus PC15]|uniref:HTH La-type RNA-binding domain-containing protein n=1 Tax=Pleurotus ostreatus (strain PC15) TaxID=1137138 RepID=A0A067NEN9_PLEO1|nr:hypothetical protein PLEOSDRAFT_1109363 [Pleurotus ostreatus PC15]